MVKEPNFNLEDLVVKQADPHRTWVCGIDEVGVGALAGPVTGAAVILSRDYHVFYDELNDSKKVSRKKRERLFEVIRKEAIADIGHRRLLCLGALRITT